MSNGTWNYRIGTYIFSYKERFPDNKKMWEIPDERMFCLISAYYENKKAKKPNSYGLNTQNIMDGFSSVKELKWTNQKIKEALKKDVLDLDNFPKTYKKKKK